LRELSQTIYLIGSLSAFFSGLAGDKFGRKRATLVFVGAYAFINIVGQLLMTDYSIFFSSAANGAALSADVRYVIYCLVQFFGGILAFSMFSSSYVLLIELTTDDYHTRFSNINIYFYVLGELMILVAYFFSRNWHITSWFIHIFSLLLFILLARVLPESPRLVKHLIFVLFFF
jgi:MFS family permease